jgi:RIO-like serine/threonine protein kinase
MPDFIYRTLVKLQAEYPTLVPDLPRIGESLGCGSDGYVYQYGPNRVLKVSTFAFHNPRVAIERVKFFLQRPHKHVVNVYACGLIGEVYWYEMEQLRPLSEEEVNIFYEVFENHDEYMADLGATWQLRIYKKHRKSRLHRRMLRFLRQAQKLPLIHHDLHNDNIMKDRRGKYKLIDVESIRSRKATGSYLGYDELDIGSEAG